MKLPLTPELRQEAARLLKAEVEAALWAKGIVWWKLWPQQLVIYETIRKLPITTQTVVILCARQFGKSVLGCLLALEDCLSNPGVVVLICGPTIKQTRSIVYPRMKILCENMPESLKAEKRPFPVMSEDTWYFANGSELKLGGFETGAAKQRGKTIYRIYLEETCESDGDTYEEFLRSDLGPALTHSKHAQIIHLTTLPKVPDHPFCLETIPEAELGGAYFKFTIDDNRQLSQEKYDACVKLAGGKKSIDFRREYLCEQVRDSSIILAPEFDEALHVAKLEIPPYAKFWVAGDTGGVRDKTVFLLFAYDFVNAKTLVLAERAFDPDTPSTAMIEAFLEMEGGRKVSRHFDAPGQLQIDFAAQGYPGMLPRKDSLEASVNQVRVALGSGIVLIDSSCKLLITTLRSGCFNKLKTDLGRTKALGHMDAFMALCYGLRHVNRENPYPLYNGAQPHTHYIRPSIQNQTAKGLMAAFKG